MRNGKQKNTTQKSRKRARMDKPIQKTKPRCNSFVYTFFIFICALDALCPSSPFSWSPFFAALRRHQFFSRYFIAFFCFLILSLAPPLSVPLCHSLFLYLALLLMRFIFIISASQVKCENQQENNKKVSKKKQRENQLQQWSRKK